MSAQGLLSTVFSCSLSPKTISKRRLRKTRSLDPALLMRHYGTEAEETSYKYYLQELKLESEGRSVVAYNHKFRKWLEFPKG